MHLCLSVLPLHTPAGGGGHIGFSAVTSERVIQSGGRGAHISVMDPPGTRHRPYTAITAVSRCPTSNFLIFHFCFTIGFGKESKTIFVLWLCLEGVTRGERRAYSLTRRHAIRCHEISKRSRAADSASRAPASPRGPEGARVRAAGRRARWARCACAPGAST